MVSPVIFLLNGSRVYVHCTLYTCRVSCTLEYLNPLICLLIPQFYVYHCSLQEYDYNYMFMCTTVVYKNMTTTTCLCAPL